MHVVRRSVSDVRGTGLELCSLEGRLVVVISGVDLGPMVTGNCGGGLLTAVAADAGRSVLGGLGPLQPFPTPSIVSPRNGGDDLGLGQGRAGQGMVWLAACNGPTPTALTPSPMA